MKLTAKEFDEKFEKEDISEFLDFENGMSLKEFKKNIKSDLVLNLPQNIYELIDKEAKIVGIDPSDLVKVWIVERLKEIKSL